jgi:hypothetical protein
MWSKALHNATRPRSIWRRAVPHACGHRRSTMPHVRGQYGEVPHACGHSDLQCHMPVVNGKNTCSSKKVARRIYFGIGNCKSILPRPPQCSPFRLLQVAVWQSPNCPILMLQGRTRMQIASHTHVYGSDLFLASCQSGILSKMLDGPFRRHIPSMCFSSTSRGVLHHKLGKMYPRDLYRGKSHISPSSWQSGVSAEVVMSNNTAEEVC